MFDKEKNYKNVSANVQGYEKNCTITILLPQQFY